MSKGLDYLESVRESIYIANVELEEHNSYYHIDRNAELYDIEKELKALEIIKIKPFESASAINYIQINKNNPIMLDYEHYCMTIKDKLPQEEYEELKEVLEND